MLHLDDMSRNDKELPTPASLCKQWGAVLCAPLSINVLLSRTLVFLSVFICEQLQHFDLLVYHHRDCTNIDPCSDRYIWEITIKKTFGKKQMKSGIY